MNIKCNICGGDVAVSADKTFATCEYCGSTVTVPRVSDEQRAAAFNRGSHFRRIGEFDKALASYERILREDDTDAEAHWCAALCRFGIEYVEDPATYEWLPTCHRASFDSFLEDVDFKAALEHSDGLTRRLYQKEAAKIAEVQRGILATSQNEEPYDVFLCYKETGEDGQRTRDSILAQDIYYQLTDQGHRVFFSRITLEDKAGSQYEPYIFAALNSAKVMVAVGTKPEHFSAVWVKNEWSRFLALMRRDRSRVLLPCYRDMDPYDLPEQLAVLQSYDMGKIGFIQDLIRGVDKVVKAGKATPAAPAAPVVVQAAEPVVIQQSAATNANALVKRGYMALEDGEWVKAEEYFDQALNQNAELADAYLGKFLASQHCVNLSQYSDSRIEHAKKLELIPQTIDIDDSQAEDEAIAEYSIPGFFDADDIRAMFHAPCTFGSYAAALRQQLETEQHQMDHHKDLRRAVSFGGKDYRHQFTTARSRIVSGLESLLDGAHLQDEAARVEAVAAHGRHMEEIRECVRARYIEIDTSLDQKYQELILQAKENQSAPRYYQWLISEFQKLGRYKDADNYRSAIEEMLREHYDKLCREQSNAVSAEDFKLLEEQFRELRGYLDSHSRSQDCKDSANKVYGHRLGCCLLFLIMAPILLFAAILSYFG